MKGGVSGHADGLFCPRHALLLVAPQQVQKHNRHTNRIHRDTNDRENCDKRVFATVAVYGEIIPMPSLLWTQSLAVENRKSGPVSAREQPNRASGCSAMLRECNAVGP